jgi:hypothetical protein
MKMELTLENLKDLDFGKLSVAFDQHIRRAVGDCMDRPGDDHERKVILTFGLRPEKSQEADCDHVMLEGQVTSKVPAHRSRVFQCAPRKGGHLVFDSLSPEHVEQMSLEDEERRGQTDTPGNGN